MLYKKSQTPTEASATFIINQKVINKNSRTDLRVERPLSTKKVTSELWSMLRNLLRSIVIEAVHHRLEHLCNRRALQLQIKNISDKIQTGQLPVT